MSTPELLAEYRVQIKKAIAHLSYSYRKVLSLPTDVTTLDTEQLETWESFVSRFSRVSDIFLSKYVRATVLHGDPAFRGSLRDFVDQAEKLGLIDDADQWMSIRELRNQAAHDYADDKLSQDFEKMRTLAPTLIEIEKRL